MTSQSLAYQVQCPENIFWNVLVLGKLFSKVRERANLQKTQWKWKMEHPIKSTPHLDSTSCFFMEKTTIIKNGCYSSLCRTKLRWRMLEIYFLIKIMLRPIELHMNFEKQPVRYWDLNPIPDGVFRNLLHIFSYLTAKRLEPSSCNFLTSSAHSLRTFCQKNSGEVRSSHQNRSRDPTSSVLLLKFEVVQKPKYSSEQFQSFVSTRLLKIVYLRFCISVSWVQVTSMAFTL